MKRIKEVQKKIDELLKELSPQGKLQHPNTLLHRAAQLWPTRIALICEDRSITFKALTNRAAYLAKKLVTEKGITPGDRVLILYENSIDFYIGYHAAWIAGAIVAPLNVFLSEKELEHIISDAKPRLIITSPSLSNKIATQISTPFMCDNLTELTADGETFPVNFTPRSPAITDCTLLLYTSGTTGLPKGVMHSGQSIMTNCIQGISNLDFTAQERLLAALPLFHSYMQNVSVWSALIVSALVIIVPRISRPALLRGLSNKPTIIPGIPQLFGLFCLMKKVDFSTVKLFVSGGDALTPMVKLWFELLFNRRLINGYGLTETAPFIAVNFHDGHAPTHCVGKPLGGIELSIRTDNKFAKPGTIGTIWVRGENVMLGYYNAPEATRAVLVDGWFNTGDLGYIDVMGRLILAGREKDLIIHNGIKIYPQEIESIIAQHPNVQTVAVIGIKSGKAEVTAAFIVLNKPMDNIEKELKKLCKQFLAPYKIPQLFYLRDKLPQTATGKIDKKVLRLEVAREILE